MSPHNETLSLCGKRDGLAIKLSGKVTLFLGIGCYNVTLLVEMKDKEFTSHKAKYALQFGTNNNMIGLSLTFKSIKQKIQFSQNSEQISFLMF